MSVCKDCFHSYVCERFNKHRECDNKKCHFANDHFVSAGLINRQKAEIERLKEDNEIKSQKRANIFEITNAYERGRAEAVKEFAKRLKKDISWHRTEMYMNGLKGTPRTHEITYECVEEYIDNLVKEFTEGE